MIDLKAARSDPDGWRAALARKGAAEPLDALLAADECWRALVPEVDNLRSRTKLKGKPSPEEIEAVQGVKVELKRAEEALAAAEAERDAVLAVVLELAGALDGDDVTRLLDHADHPAVAAVVVAELAQLGVGDVEAAVAEAHLLLGVADRRGEAADVVGGDLQQVEGDALRRARPDPGEPSELVDQRLDGRGEGTGQAQSSLPTSRAPGNASERRSSTDGPPLSTGRESSGRSRSSWSGLSGHRSRRWH